MKKKLVLFRQLFVIGCLLFLCGTKLEAGAAQKQISDYIDVPAYQGEEAVEINDNEPFFDENDSAFLPEQYYASRPDGRAAAQKERAAFTREAISSLIS